MFPELYVWRSDVRIAFLVNSVATEQPGYTTVRVFHAAVVQGHEAWILGIGDMTYGVDERVYAHGRTPNPTTLGKARAKDHAAMLRHLQSSECRRETICLDETDILLLRNNPADDIERPWAQSAGVVFGRLLTMPGVVVLNDPDGLGRAMNKMYFQSFPEEVRPRSIITRDRNEIRRFAKAENGPIIVKPLQGSGGKDVFLIDRDSHANLNQIVESVGRSGYIIAQEYLPKAESGDTRLFLMNGVPLRHKGKFAAFRRARAGDDIRSNVHAGGTIEQAPVTDEMLRVAEIVRPRLVEDGMFLVGLDIVGDKLMEINVFSPGGIGSAQKFEKVNFADAILAALERKVSYMRYYRREFSNNELATL